VNIPCRARGMPLDHTMEVRRLSCFWLFFLPLFSLSSCSSPFHLILFFNFSRTERMLYHSKNDPTWRRIDMFVSCLSWCRC
jgi:hypothetical protein